jgi:Spy/CpxP family protein refolding chaperone
MENTMRKTILLGLGLTLSLAGAALAQQPEQRGMRRDRAGDERGPGMRGRGGPDGLMLKGITLTEGQRTQIAQVQKTQREQMESRREVQRKDHMEQVRAARQKGDTAAVRSIVERNRAAMATERQQHLTAIRNILTAEQRPQFDKNVAELQTRVGERALRQPGSRAGRGPRAGR